MTLNIHKVNMSNAIPYWALTFNPCHFFTAL